ncbi:MAG TPA: glycosyltransferase family 1 protein, partial [Candidatus Paceibacterota bacterium]
ALMSYAMDNRAAKGSALYTRKLIEGMLPSNEFDFYLVHYDKVSDPLYQKANEIIMPKVKLPYGGRLVSQLLFFWKYRKNPFDVVHWFHPRVYPFFWLVPAKKIIVTVHGAGDITAPTNFIFSRSVFNFVLKHFYRSIDIIVADSNFGKEEVVEHYGFPKEKVRTIYLGGGENYKPMDKNEAKSIVSQKYKIDSPYILDVSRLQPHKNVGGLIRAYDLMRKTNPNRTEKLVIVGGGAYNKVPEYGIAEQATFSKDIRFVDFVDKADLNAVYSASELFVFPSLNEGFGLPVVEAMASGVPVITSNITSMPEIGGDAVITVNPLDISGLAGTMHMVLTDRVLQRKMIELGLNRASGFTWGKTVRDTEDLYK